MLKSQVGSLFGVAGCYWMLIKAQRCSRMFTDVHGCSQILNVVKFWLRTLLVTICRFSGLRSQMIAYVSYIGWSGIYFDYINYNKYVKSYFHKQ